jgi:HK97 family phage major capsid protein
MSEKTENLTPEEVVSKIDNMISEKMNGVATSDDVKHLQTELDGLKNLSEKSSEIEKTIAKMEGRLEAMSEKAQKSGSVPSSMGLIVAKSINEKLEALKGGQGFELEVKDTTIIGDYTGTRALSELDSEINRIARAENVLLNAVNRGTTSSKFVTYIQQTAQPTGAWLTEATSKTEYEEKYAEISKEVKKVAGFVKVSKEMLQDLSFVQSEINNDLIQGVLSKMENSILNGAGGSDLEGILSFASTFSAGTFANTIISANILDVIRVAIAQIQSANFNATHVILNPIDVAKMQLTKTSSGEYTMPIFYPSQNNEMKVANLIVVSTTYMTAGNFLVGDMKRANLKIRENVNLSVGYESDDFKRNMVTILAEARAVHYVKLNDVNAFVKGVLATAIAQLDPAIAG